MFERDLPGENKSGLSFQQASALPLETCETINGSWGYNITDHRYKTVNQVVQLLAGAAGRDANLLLNVGPMPNGEIQPEFTDTLSAAGQWLKKFGGSIYGTRKGPLNPQSWGVTTQKDKTVYVHLFSAPADKQILIPGALKISSVKVMGSGVTVKYKQQKEDAIIYLDGIPVDGPDTVVEISVK